MVAGRLLIYLLQKNGLLKKFWNINEITQELGTCDLCLGVWVYAALAWILSINLMAPVYYPVISEVLTGALASFAMHLARIGWQSQYGTIELH